MKLIVVILASESPLFNAFKNVILDHFYNLPNDIKDKLEFYFIYSSNHNQIIQKDNYVDFHDFEVDGDISKNMFIRTISLFRHLRSKYNLDNNENYFKHRDSPTYILRTNLTTFFDFKKLLDWLQDKPSKSFIAGSFNGLYNGVYTTLSGTNIIMTLDLMMYLSDIDTTIMNYQVFSEDELLSRHIIENLNVHIINLKRLDLIEMNEPQYNYVYPKSIIYHKCKPFDDSIFSFRFKTFDRDLDLDNMKFFSENIHKTNLTNLLNQFVILHPTWKVTTENPEYASNYSERTFKIFNLS
jgi:hypothetical protein